MDAPAPTLASPPQFDSHTIDRAPRASIRQTHCLSLLSKRDEGKFLPAHREGLNARCKPEWPRLLAMVVILLHFALEVLLLLGTPRFVLDGIWHWRQGRVVHSILVYCLGNAYPHIRLPLGTIYDVEGLLLRQQLLRFSLWDVDNLRLLHRPQAQLGLGPHASARSCERQCQPARGC